MTEINSGAGATKGVDPWLPEENVCQSSCVTFALTKFCSWHSYHRIMVGLRCPKKKPVSVSRSARPAAHASWALRKVDALQPRTTTASSQMEGHTTKGCIDTPLQLLHGIELSMHPLLGAPHLASRCLAFARWQGRRESNIASCFLLRVGIQSNPSIHGAGQTRMLGYKTALGWKCWPVGQSVGGWVAGWLGICSSSGGCAQEG